jgi:hypothetical protein
MTCHNRKTEVVKAGRAKDDAKDSTASNAASGSPNPRSVHLAPHLVFPRVCHARSVSDHNGWLCAVLLGD